MKYKITDIKHTNRIRALKDFGNIKAGDLGGFIQKESNLIKEGNCRVYDNAWVSGNVRINLIQEGNCRLYDNAHISGNVRINLIQEGNCRLYDNAHISGNVKIFGI
jgi:cytoskeletal protein CcmA (bactofilin family)